MASKNTPERRIDIKYRAPTTSATSSGVSGGGSIAPHDLVGIYHTVSGLTPGYLVVAVDSLTFAWGQGDHGISLTGLTDDDHTQYVHIATPRTITAGHTFSANQSIQSVNLTGGNGTWSTSGWNKSLIFPSTGYGMFWPKGATANNWLIGSTSSGGNSNLYFGYNAADDASLPPNYGLILTPAQAIFQAFTTVASNGFSSGFTGSGWRIDNGIATSGQTQAEFDNLVVRGRMSVYELLVHQIRATNGSIFVSSTGKAKTVTGTGPYTITTETDHGFLAGDLIRAQRFTGAGVYQSNCQVTGVTSTTVFTVTLISGNVPAAGMEFVRLGSATNSTRRGSIYMSADDTGAPFISIQDGVASFSDWGSVNKIRWFAGKLDNIGYTGEWGMFAGSSTQYLVAGSNGLRIQNADINLYASGSLTTEITATDGIGLQQDAYTGTWTNPRAIQWWPNILSKTTPSLEIHSGKYTSGFTINQDESVIQATPTGGVVAILDIIAKGYGSGSPAILRLQGESNAGRWAEADLIADVVTINDINGHYGKLYLGGSISSLSTWSTSGWKRLIELENAAAIVWPHTGSGYSRMVGSTSNGSLYIGRSTENDNSAAPTYDVIVDTNGDVTIGQQLVLSSFDNGTGAGNYAQIGRNSNVSTPAAGHLILHNKSATTYAIWPDTSGNLRINTSSPTNSTDTGGTVIGTQTSWHGTKNIAGEATDKQSLLDAVLGVRLYDYTIKRDTYERSDGETPTYTGIVISDEDRDRNAWYGSGYGQGQIPSLNERNLFGYSIGAIQALAGMVADLQEQVKFLADKVARLQ